MIFTTVIVNVLDVNPGNKEGNGWTWNGSDDSQEEWLIVNGIVKFVGGALYYGVKNKKIIVDGTFASKVNNEGTIENGTFYKEVDNLGGLILGGTFKGVVHNDGIIKNIIAKDGFAVRADSNKNIEKITIIDNGVKLDNVSFSKIDNIEIQKGAKVIFAGISPEAAAAKSSGEGIIVIDNKAYHTDGSIIESNQNGVLINDSFKITKAAQNAKEQKYLDLKNDENDGNSGLDLLVPAQNDGEILL